MNLPKLLLIAVAGLASLSLIALSNGPIETEDARPWTGDTEVTHSSTVYYGKTTNPFVAYVDRIYFGGRPAADLEWWQFASEWKRDATLYQRWDGSKWKTVLTVPASSWQDCGSPDNLCVDNLYNEATLRDGALVRQRLKYRYFWYAGEDLQETSFSGIYHDHFLE